MKDKIQGKIEETKGKVTDDPAEIEKGRLRQAAGETKRVARDVVDEVKDAAHKGDAEKAR